MAFLLFIIFATIVIQCYGSFQINSNETFENSSVVLPTVPDDDIYKCISYTGAHIDTSHWINQNFSDYKDCQTSGLYNLNRRDRHFKVDIIIQYSWIVDVSVIIYDGTIRPICGINSVDFIIRPTDSCERNGINATITETERFETLSLYYDIGNLTIIMTHNKRGEPLHFNINIWQLQSAINDSNGLCAGPTCSSKARHNLYRNYQRSSYPTGVIVLMCNIYIGNYLKSMAPQPWERSLHYNRTIENVQKACRADIQIQHWPHAAAGSLEVLFVEDQVNSTSITTVADIQINFQTNLEDNLIKLADTMDLSRAEVDILLSNLTTTTTTTTTPTTTTTTLSTTMRTSIESQPTTLSTSTSRITSTMTSVTFTSTGTLSPTSIIITTTTESPKTQTLIKTTKVFLTFDYTTTQSNTTNMAMIIGCSTRENIILLGLLLFSVIFYI
ncbi:unnamed protein product [Rotaria sordida]|uniref:Uncharacterized protein n=1 Tax=Rotaria sordida TaxID=392033 RepID=A0A815C2T8_9BILA|nr:unnamed protein product [Rotaria sordida]